MSGTAASEGYTTARFLFAMILWTKRSLNMHPICTLYLNIVYEKMRVDFLFVSDLEPGVINIYSIIFLYRKPISQRAEKEEIFPVDELRVRTRTKEEAEHFGRKKREKEGGNCTTDPSLGFHPKHIGTDTPRTRLPSILSVKMTLIKGKFCQSLLLFCILLVPGKGKVTFSTLIAPF
jgi:hypothetical protein